MPECRDPPTETDAAGGTFQMCPLHARSEKPMQKPQHEHSEYDVDFWTLLCLLILVAVLAIGMLLLFARP